MSFMQPEDFREILRRVQDPNVSIEEANQLFVNYV